YDVRGDIDLDGDVDSTDKTAALANAGADLGIGNLSGDPTSATGNRKGYAGYELATSLAGSAGIYDVKNRFLIASLGRWTRRDPLGYVDGANLYQYVRSNPLAGVDPMGTIVYDDCPACVTPPDDGEVMLSFDLDLDEIYSACSCNQYLGLSSPGDASGHDACTDCCDSRKDECDSVAQSCFDACLEPIETCKGDCADNCNSSLGCVIICTACEAFYALHRFICVSNNGEQIAKCTLNFIQCHIGCDGNNIDAAWDYCVAEILGNTCGWGW
ncbi:MAG: hypothetical protein IH984_10150, partial [Planctomycetes bacterium]|nr:hypothetical protein [Planctomycetota bacterium]